MLTHLRNRRRRTDERGAVVVITALLTCFVLIIVAALTVDLGNTWARRGQLQSQADNAAIFAASYLPASQPATRLTAAKAAVWYLACNPVVGQEAAVNVDFPIPRNADGSFKCTGSFVPTSTDYQTTASTLITKGYISFPNPYEISVRTPAARVDFGFAGAVGASGSVQTKSATAHVYSPGQMVPMGGSLTCIAAAANNTGLLGLGDTLSSIAPINYWSAGGGSNSLTSSSGGSSTVATWPAITAPLPVSPQNLTTDSATLAAGGGTLSVTYSINTGLTGLVSSILSGLLNNLIGQNVTVWFGRGTTNIPVSVPITLVGSATVNVPAAVKSSPGQWYVKVVAPMPTYNRTVSLTNPLGLPIYTGSTPKQATTQKPISIGASDLSDLTNLNNFLSCARPVVSPRTPTRGVSQDMIDNIRNGLDHSLGQHPSLLTAAQGITNPATTSIGSLVSSLTSNPTSFLFGCGTDTVSIKDVAANAASSPNCLTVDTTTTYDYEFTQGFLTNDGRLSCTRATCRDGHTFDGSTIGVAGRYNNDRISDFISGANQQSVLNDLLFTSLDTFLLGSIPVATPGNQISAGLYSSPRFFWTPVLTTAYLPGTAAASYPVLTFRPAFITQESPTPTAVQKLLSTLALELRVDLSAIISGGITALLNGTLLSSIQAGIQLNVDGQTLLGSLGDSTKKEQYGLVYDTSADTTHKLKALRVMNINPGALPTVDQNYTGPVSDYFGSGPKVIRLVK